MVSAGLLAKMGFSVNLLEKGTYPRHKVCGEFVSFESEFALDKMGVVLRDLSPIKIEQFTLSTTTGSKARLNLPQPGIGLSRYKLENVLYEQLLKLGVTVNCKTKVTEVSQLDGDAGHIVHAQHGNTITSKLVIGAFGKRSGLQVISLNRSGYFAAKNHYRFPFNPNEVQLHMFPGGYGGMSMVESNLVNFCYLGKTVDLKKSGSIEAYQKMVVGKNPYLKELLDKGEPMLKKTLTISQIDFGHRNRVSNGVFHAGDAGGVIHPLSGNGMSMAINSALLLSEVSERFLSGRITRKQMENQYSKSWEKSFGLRMISSRFYQSLFEHSWGRKIAVGALKNKTLGRKLIRLTHGKPQEYVSNAV